MRLCGLDSQRLAASCGLRTFEQGMRHQVSAADSARRKNSEPSEKSKAPSPGGFTLERLGSGWEAVRKRLCNVDNYRARLAKRLRTVEGAHLDTTSHDMSEISLARRRL